MKRRTVIALAAIVTVVLILTAFTACDGDKLMDSSWEAAVIRDARGEIVACGEDYCYGEEFNVETVTCTVSGDGELTLYWAEGESTVKGTLTETGTGADDTVRYSIEFSDGTAGTATYIQDKDAVYPSDANKDDSLDLPEKYELIVTYGEEYTLYFVRVSQIK